MPAPAAAHLGARIPIPDTREAGRDDVFGIHPRGRSATGRSGRRAAWRLPRPRTARPIESIDSAGMPICPLPRSARGPASALEPRRASGARRPTARSRPRRRRKRVNLLAPVALDLRLPSAGFDWSCHESLPASLSTPSSASPLIDPASPAGEGARDRSLACRSRNQNPDEGDLSHVSRPASTSEP